MRNVPDFSRIKELIARAEQEPDARFSVQLVMDALWALVQIVEQQSKAGGKS